MKFDSKKLTKVLIIIAAAIVILFFFRCPIKLFLGIDCPGCGMTRAFKSAVMLDFKAAFEYHPMFFVIAIEVLYYVLSRFIIKKKFSEKTEEIVLIITAIAMILLWIFRQFIIKLF